MSNKAVTQARAGQMDNEWWPVFLDELSQWPNVSRACRKAGISRVTAYRHKADYQDFNEAWENAIETGLDKWEEEAARRAFEGVDKPVIYQGEITDTFKEYSDTLAVTMLKAHRPEKYRERSEVKTDGNLTINVKYEEE